MNLNLLYLKIANALRQQQCAMSSGNPGTPTPLTVLTEDEIMMKETGKCSFNILLFVVVVVNQFIFFNLCINK